MYINIYTGYASIFNLFLYNQSYNNNNFYVQEINISGVFFYGKPTPNIGYTTRNVYIELQVRKDSLITFLDFSMFILQK